VLRRDPRPVIQHPHLHLAVRLAPELRDALQLEADARGVDLDRLVEDALKDWLKSK
jgi:predicted HicB family RNase H-like nuclease